MNARSEPARRKIIAHDPVFHAVEAQMFLNSFLQERHGRDVVGGKEDCLSRHGGSPGGAVGVRGGKGQEYNK